MNKKTRASEHLRNINVHSASLFLILLFCADLAFIALHSIEALTSFLNSSLFSITKDRSYPEIYQYLKWFWIIILLAYISILMRSFSYIAWSLVFIYFICDDALSIHEIVGKYLAGQLTFTPPLGLRLQDIGELAVTATAGTILLPIVVLAYFRGTEAFKKMSRDMLLLILALVFFGVFVDMLHISIQLGWKVSFILGVIEDGGEMLVGSLILWYVFRLSVCDENTTSYLFDFVRAALTRRST